MKTAKQILKEMGEYLVINGGMTYGEYSDKFRRDAKLALEEEFTRTPEVDQNKPERPTGKMLTEGQVPNRRQT